MRRFCCGPRWSSALPVQSSIPLVAVCPSPLLQPHPLLGCNSHVVETQHRGARRQTWRCFYRPIVVSSLYSTVLDLTSLPNLISVKVVSNGEFHPYVRRFRGHPESVRHWVEGTLVLSIRLFEVRCGTSCAIFFRGTQSQARDGASLSAPWFDTGIAQGWVLSPLLFNLLVDN